MKKEDKKLPAAFYYLSFKNIRQDVQRYGFAITPVKLMLYYLVTIAGCVLVCIPFHLPLLSKLCISALGMLCLPLVIMSACKRKYEEGRFVETGIYLSQMLSAFAIKPKVLYALQSTQKVVTSEPMRQAVTEAIDYILHTPYSTGDAREEALKIIEKSYGCKRVRTLHRFLVNVENKGGEYKRTVDLLQKDRELWEERVEDFRKDEKAKKGEAVTAAVFVIAVCWLVLLLSSYIKFDISGSVVYQISTTVMLMAEMLLYIKINCSLNIDLLEKVTTRPPKAILKDYHMVTSYDPDKETARSIRNSILPVLIMAAGLLFHKPVLIAAGAVFLFLAVFNRRIGYSMTVSQLKKEVGFAYPQWLMEMALLLQENNVRNSIRLTVENAHPVLREALENMTAELDEAPTSMEPYMNFLVPLRTKEINASMSLLYAASSGTNGDADERITEIINSTIKMTDKAEKLENEDRLLGLDLLFKAPAIPGAINILVYTAIVMMQAMNMNTYLS